MKKLFNMDNKYIGWGITAFVVIACAIIFYMLLHYVDSVMRFVHGIFGILSPFIWGAIITYILAPFIDYNETRIFTPLLAKAEGKRISKYIRFLTSRGLSIAMAEIIMDILGADRRGL